MWTNQVECNRIISFALSRPARVSGQPVGSRNLAKLALDLLVNVLAAPPNAANLPSLHSIQDSAKLSPRNPTEFLYLCNLLCGRSSYLSSFADNSSNSGNSATFLHSRSESRSFHSFLLSAA